MSTDDRDTHAELADWDAAYVLGALTPSDRHRFDAHLATCARCRDAVADFSGLPGLLSTVTKADLATLEDGRLVTDSPPVELLPRLAAAVRRHRRRRQFAGAGGVLAAAAAVVVALVVIWPGGSTAPTPSTTAPSSTGVVPNQAGPLQLTPLTSGPLAVAVTLVGQPWGTRIDLECRFRTTTGSAGTPSGPPRTYDYALFVTDRAGTTEPAGSWSYSPGTASTEPVGSSSWNAADIATVEVRTDDGKVLLRGAF